jgi:glycosyltransferase involved in cell wall biosynthesis
MSRAAVFASPSIYEPFGLAALEAAHAGCALVLADIPTYRELWEGAAAFVDPRDVDALAGALNALAAGPDDRARLAASARARAQSYAPERQLAALRDAYAAMRAPVSAE